MEKINVAELLKDCPKGMELDCTMCDKFVLVGVDNSLMFPIKVRCEDGCLFALTKYGQCCDSDYAKCVIFPKGKTTWEGFVPPWHFKDGDIAVTNEGDIHLLRTKDSSYCAYRERWEGLPKFDKTITTSIRVERLATEEEKAKLFQAIKDNGYRWNAETKTLEKLIQPKFKVGDRIRHKTHIRQGDVVTEIKDTHYILNDEFALPFILQDEYELVLNKFDINTLVPFESRVLVRNSNNGFWQPTFWGIYEAGKANEHQNRNYLTTKGFFRHCIPYNDDTKHLLGTTDDCDEYFKTWK